MRRLSALIFALALALPITALALTGQSYDTFNEYYKANVTFINDNTNRHLLPMVLSQRASTDNDGRMYYDIIGDVLNVLVTTDSAGIIEECEIRFSAPAGISYGSLEYNDLAISGYHSYAFLMAMDTNTDPAKRYDLVSDVEQGIKSQNGAYTRQLGAYTLTCSRVDSATEVLNFANNGVPLPTPTPDPNATASPEPTAPSDDATAPTDDTTAPSDETPTDTDDYIG